LYTSWLIHHDCVCLALHEVVIHHVLILIV
jgi:hypothetical protein